MNPQIEAVQQAAAILRAAFPVGHLSIDLSEFEGVTVNWFGARTYAEATEWLRALGVKDRSKSVYMTYTALRGQSEIAPTITWTAFTNELPPTCRKVKKIERVTQTVETGEYIEITREVIVCGGEEAV